MLCLVPHLATTHLKKARRAKNKPIDRKIMELGAQLSHAFFKSPRDLDQFLIPSDYQDLEDFYYRETLCEHHAILKLLVGDTNCMPPEEEIDNQNFKFEYYKIGLFDRMRSLGVPDSHLNSAVSMLKKNAKNLDRVSRSVQLGYSIQSDSIPIFQDLQLFSRVMTRKNLDLNAIVALSGSIYLVTT